MKFRSSYIVANLMIASAFVGFAATTAVLTSPDRDATCVVAHLEDSALAMLGRHYSDHAKQPVPKKQDRLVPEASPPNPERKPMSWILRPTLKMEI